MLEFINEIWDCLSKLISEYGIGLSSILVSILIGVAPIKIARNSLIFNQRSLLIKDSYEPILLDIKDNNPIKLISSTELSYDKLRKVKESYVYHAFEKSDQELMDKILELEGKINSFKRKSNNIISRLLVNLLNKNYSADVIETQKSNAQRVITEVFIGDAIKNSKESFIDIFLNRRFHELVLFNSGEHIWCRWEEFDLVKIPMVLRIKLL